MSQVYLHLKSASEFFADRMNNPLAQHAQKPPNLALEEVQAACLRQLRDGKLVAWSSDWTYSIVENPFSEDERGDGCVSKPLRWGTEFDELSKIPEEFWEFYAQSMTINRSFEPTFDSFEFYILEHSYDRSADTCKVIRGKASNVLIGSHDASIKVVPKAENGEPEHVEKKNLGGRPPANWWPVFAAELAMYIFENGPPSGEGTAGQSEVIKVISQRIANRIDSEPSHSSMRGVVNEVLKRIRAK